MIILIDRCIDGLRRVQCVEDAPPGFNVDMLRSQLGNPPPEQVVVHDTVDDAGTPIQVCFVGQDGDHGTGPIVILSGADKLSDHVLATIQ